MSEMAETELSTENLLKKHETYIKINEDLSNKCQEFKVHLGVAQNEIVQLRNEGIQDKFRYSVLRKAFFEISKHGKQFIESFEKTITEASEKLGFDNLPDDEVCIDPLEFRPPSRAQNIDPNRTEFKDYMLRTVREEDEIADENHDHNESGFLKTRSLTSSTPLVSSSVNVKALRDIKNTKQVVLPSAKAVFDAKKSQPNMPDLTPLETPNRANVPTIFRKLSSEIVNRAGTNESTLTDHLKIPTRAQSEDKENSAAGVSSSSVESVNSSIHETVAKENPKLPTIVESIISGNVTIRSRSGDQSTSLNSQNIEHESLHITQSDIGAIKIPENIPTSTQNPVRTSRESRESQESNDDDKKSESKEASDDDNSDWEDIANQFTKEIKQCVVELQEIPISTEQVESFVKKYQNESDSNQSQGKDETAQPPQPSTSKASVKKALKRKSSEKALKIKLEPKRKRRNDSVSTVESEFNSSSVSTSTAINKTKANQPKPKKRKSATFKIRTSGGGNGKTKSKKGRNSGSIGKRKSTEMNESIATKRPSRSCKPTTSLKEPSTKKKLRRT